MKLQYYVYSEGYGNTSNGETKYFGNLELRSVNVYLDEDGCIDEYEYEGGVNDTQAFISDKWGGAEIVNTPDEFEPEFTNGLIDYGFFDTLEAAQKEYNSLITGEIDYNELEQ